MQLYKRTLAISNNIDIDDHVARTHAIEFFAHQFKCTSREKFSVFVPKGAITGPNLTFLCNNMF